MSESIISPPVGTITEWNDEEWTAFREWLRDVLRHEVAQIIFTKTDGTERVMNCTLRTDKIIVKPVIVFTDATSELEQLVGKSKPRINNAKQRKDSHLTISVFDVDKEEWRSFRIRNITNIYTLLLKYGTTQ